MGQTLHKWKKMNQIKGLPSLEHKVASITVQQKDWVCSWMRVGLTKLTNKSSASGERHYYFFSYILPFGNTRLPQPHPEQMCGSLCALKLCLLLEKREWFRHKSAHNIVFGLSWASEARGLSHDSCNETWMSGLIDALRTIKIKHKWVGMLFTASLAKIMF